MSTMIIKTRKLTAGEVKKKLHDFIDELTDGCEPELIEMAEDLKAHGDELVDALSGEGNYRSGGMYRHGGYRGDGGVYRDEGYRGDMMGGGNYRRGRAWHRNEGTWEEREELRKRNEKKLQELDRQMQELKQQMGEY